MRLATIALHGLANTTQASNQAGVTTYEPGQGVAGDVGPTRKGFIDRDDFARSRFARCLGPKPPTQALRKGLLGSHP